MSANVGYVGHNATHLVTPVEGNQPLPGVGAIRRPGCRCSSGVRCIATAPLITNISTTASRGRSDYNGLQVSLRQRNVKGVEYLASYTLSRTRTNNLGYYGSGGVAGRGRVLGERLRSGGELRAGVLRRPAQLRVLGELRAAVRERAEVGGRCVAT